MNQKEKAFTIASIKLRIEQEAEDQRKVEAEMRKI